MTIKMNCQRIALIPHFWINLNSIAYLRQFYFLVN